MKKKSLVKRVSAVALAMLLVSGTMEMVAGGIVANAEEGIEVGAELLSDASFEAGIWASGTSWSVLPEHWDSTTIADYTESTHDGGNAINYWTQDAQVITISQSVNLEAGTYSFSAYNQGALCTSYLFIDSQQSSPVSLTGWGTWDELSGTFTVIENGTYSVGIVLNNNDGGWGYIDDMSLKCTSLAGGNGGQGGSGDGGQGDSGNGGQGDNATMNDIALINGDFEDGTSGWTLTGFNSVAINSWASNNTTNTLSLWLSDDDAVAGAAEYVIKLSAGEYAFSFEVSGKAAASGLRASVKNGESVLTVGSEITTTDWDVWQVVSTEEFTLTQDTEVTFSLAGNVTATYWGNIDNLTLKGTGSIVTGDGGSGDGGQGDSGNGDQGGQSQITYYPESEPVVGELEVERVTQLSTAFIMGVDISSVMSEFASGVVYYDYDGNVINNIDSFCAFLKAQGITHVRVRVWNDPKDANGNGYGGGNNDVATAKAIADACRSAGLKMLVDFHCSDFWTDPGKQFSPKAWSGKTSTEKAALLNTFVGEALSTIDASKDVVDMVQIGNETNNGIAGETSVAAMCELFNSGAAAVRAYNSNAKVVIHVTNPEKSTMTSWAQKLDANNVDYDIIGTSYYPYWHGTLSNLKSQMNTVRSTYNKDVMVVETSYAYTLNDTDGHSNTVRVGNNDDITSSSNYCTEEFSVQGQATSLRNLVQAVADVQGLGVFYWEPAWITVGDTTGLTGAALTAQVNANKAKWEAYGSGWASSYSAQYDPSDAGVWYGGSAVDNEAMFYSDGTPTAGWKIWNYVKTGAETNFVEVNSITEPELELVEGDTLNLPATVAVSYNKGVAEDAVVWNTDDVAAVDVNKAGTYTVRGIVTFSKTVNKGSYASATTAEVECVVIVKPANLLDSEVASFETGTGYTSSDGSVLKITGDDPYAGSKALHWYKTTATEENFTYDSTVALSNGTYKLTAFTQGAVGDKVSIDILDENGNVLSVGSEVTLNGWKDWKNPEVSITVSGDKNITFRINVNMTAGGWGTLDSLYLYQTASGSNSGSDGGNNSGNNGGNDGGNSSGNNSSSNSNSGNNEGSNVTGNTTANNAANANNTAKNDNKNNHKSDNKADNRTDNKNNSNNQSDADGVSVTADTTEADYEVEDDKNVPLAGDMDTADVELQESTEKPIGGAVVTAGTSAITSKSDSKKAANVSLIIGLVVAVGLVGGLGFLIIRASRFR